MNIGDKFSGQKIWTCDEHARRAKAKDGLSQPSKLNTNPEDSPETILRLFVYGSLKRGYWNHDRFIAQAQSIEPATVWGRLYHLSAGFPALEVPESLILAHGTSDPLADAKTQNQTDGLRFKRPSGDWDLIQGELVTFTDPLRYLPPIDRLEGFRPGGQSMYRRVMVAAETHSTLCPAWIYDGSPMQPGRSGSRFKGVRRGTLFG